MAKPARELPLLHRPTPVPSSAQPKQHRATMSAIALGKYLDLSPQRIQQLAAEQIIERLPNKRFNPDDCRVAYIRWLRHAERRTAKSKVDSDFVRAKTELIAIRVREKQRTLMETSEAMTMMEQMIGTVLTAMGGMAPRVARLVEGNSSLLIRREVDRIVYDTRAKLANRFNEFADQAKEPPLEKGPTRDSTEDDAS
jgi:hypothetical protein